MTFLATTTTTTDDTVPNYERAFALRPDVYAAWQALNGAVKANMDLRRYEVVTVAAAGRLRSSPCALAHGEILADRFLGAEAVARIARGGDPDDAVERAVAAIARKVVDDATSVTQADVDGLRDLGLRDAEILDVILAAAMRCFFSKVLDAVGAPPDRRFADLAPALRDALTVGRPIATS